MYSDQLVYKVVIWVFFRISLWTEKVALSNNGYLFDGHFTYLRVLPEKK